MWINVLCIFILFKQRTERMRWRSFLRLLSHILKWADWQPINHTSLLSLERLLVLLLILHWCNCNNDTRVKSLLTSFMVVYYGHYTRFSSLELSACIFSNKKLKQLFILFTLWLKIMQFLQSRALKCNVTLHRQLLRISYGIKENIRCGLIETVKWPFSVTMFWIEEWLNEISEFPDMTILTLISQVIDLFILVIRRWFISHTWRDPMQKLDSTFKMHFKFMQISKKKTEY